MLLGFDVLYVKAISPTELAHAYVVAHRVPGDSENPKILEDSFARFIESRGTPSVIVWSSPLALRQRVRERIEESFGGL